jgi:spermidine/putrescine transport system permease protein
MRRPRGLLVYAVIYMAFLYAPVLLLPVFSFNDSAITAFPLQGFTVRWYEELAEVAALHQAVWNSLQVGLATALLSTLLGTLGARAVTRYRFPARRSLTGFIMLPLVLPDIIIAIGLLVVVLGLGIGLSLTSVVVGHTLLCMPFAMAIMISSFEGFDRSLEEASADLGETAFWTFVRVTLPIVVPGLVASVLVTFTISLDEFIVAFFLTGTEPTIPIYIWSQLRFAAKLPNVLALGTILLVASFLLLALAELVRRWNEKRTSTLGSAS